MSTLPYRPTEVTALRDEAKRYGIELESGQCMKLLKLVGNRPLCIDALLMERRPSWLAEIVGSVSATERPKESREGTDDDDS